MRSFPTARSSVSDLCALSIDLRLRDVDELFRARISLTRSRTHTFSSIQQGNYSPAHRSLQMPSTSERSRSHDAPHQRASRW